jgi:hypothetical protein
MNPIRSHLDSLVNVETGVQLPPFCLVTQDLPPLALNLPKVVGVGSAVPSSTARPSAQSGTKPLPIPAGRLRDRRLREVKEGVRYAGLVLEGTKSMCGHVCHNTQILDIVVLMEDDPNKQWTFQKAINHDEANLLTQIHFLHISQGLGNFQCFEDFQETICQVERKSLFNKLQALASGNKYALHDIYGPDSRYTCRGQ